MSTTCVRLVAAVLLLAAVVAGGGPRQGVDFAHAFSNATMRCLAANNFSFAIVRAHHSDGGVDRNAPVMLRRARDAGFAITAAYLFPCTTFNATHTAFDQVNRTVAYLQQEGTPVDSIWFDIEFNPDAACAWRRGEPFYNCRFLGALVDAAARFPSIAFGVYTSDRDWRHYFDGCTVASHLPLWNPRWDGNKSMGYFAPFGGWTAPAVKQINDSVPVCGVGGGMDFDWSPAYPGM
jgi:hypothetical protein